MSERRRGAGHCRAIRSHDLDRRAAVLGGHFEFPGCSRRRKCPARRRVGDPSAVRTPVQVRPIQLETLAVIDQAPERGMCSCLGRQLAVQSQVMVLTGGPGTGKTTISRGMQGFGVSCSPDADHDPALHDASAQPALRGHHPGQVAGRAGRARHPQACHPILIGSLAIPGFAEKNSVRLRER